MANKFLQALESWSVLLMDGAMGTELQRAGIQPGECYEHWNLTHPERVSAIHQAYVKAGAEVLLTNTFQANAPALAKHGLEDQLPQLCQAGVELARTARGPHSFVLGDMAPFELRWERLDTSIEHWKGCHALLVETCSDLRASEKLKTALGKGHLPILFSFAFQRTPAGQLQTFHGFTPEDIARQMDTDALGVNCGRDIGMDDIIEIIHRYRDVTTKPLFARPNAGTPTQLNGQWVGSHTPEQMAAKLPDLLAAGVAMVGGCCGTTPAHIAAFRTVIDAWNAKKQ